jgi:FkbM family methyltransferase
VLFVDPSDARGRKLIATAGNANPPSLAEWQSLVGERQWDLVVDVGANYGEMLLNLEPMPTGMILAVEANSRVASFLTSSIRANGLPISIFVGALGSRQDIVRLDDGQAHSGLVTTRPIEQLSASGGSASLVCSTTLDLLIHRVAPVPLDCLSVCIKVDVEGSEQAVIDGAAQTLSQAREAAVMLEVLHGSVSVPGYYIASEVRAHSRPELIQDAVFRRSAPDTRQ